MVKLSIVIPVFNEQDLILELISRVEFNLKKISEDFEIIIDSLNNPNILK